MDVCVRNLDQSFASASPHPVKFFVSPSFRLVTLFFFFFVSCIIPSVSHRCLLEFTTYTHRECGYEDPAAGKAEWGELERYSTCDYDENVIVEELSVLEILMGKVRASAAYPLSPSLMTAELFEPLFGQSHMPQCERL